jgi:hypothetical protein
MCQKLHITQTSKNQQHKFERQYINQLGNRNVEGYIRSGRGCCEEENLCRGNCNTERFMYELGVVAGKSELCAMHAVVFQV